MKSIHYSSSLREITDVYLSCIGGFTRQYYQKRWGKSKWSPLLIWFNIRKRPYKPKKEGQRGLKNEFDSLNSIILSIKVLRGVKSLKRETIRGKTRFYVMAHRK